MQSSCDQTARQSTPPAASQPRPSHQAAYEQPDGPDRNPRAMPATTTRWRSPWQLRPAGIDPPHTW